MRQERLYRTEAIVLRERDYAEADRILTLLTPNGKLTAIARGIRRAISRKAGQLILFARAQLLLARGRELDTITQAESLETYEGLRQDLVRFGYACYVGELVERLAQEEEENRPLYDLVNETLRHIAEGRDPRLWTRYFELRLLSLGGYRPELFTCVGCGRALAPETNFFSLEQGGLLCPTCGAANPRAKAVSVNAQKVLRYLQTHDEAEVAVLSLTPATHAEVEGLLQAYLEYTLERELRSATFLERLRRELRRFQPDGAREES